MFLTKQILGLSVFSVGEPNPVQIHNSNYVFPPYFYDQTRARSCRVFLFWAGTKYFGLVMLAKHPQHLHFLPQLENASFDMKLKCRFFFFNVTPPGLPHVDILGGDCAQFQPQWCISFLCALMC